LIWGFVIFAILAASYIGSLIGFVLNIGQYRRLDKKIRRFLIIAYLTSLLAIIYLAVNWARKLLG
jgi:type VI protein secretion system component VasK